MRSAFRALVSRRATLAGVLGGVLGPTLAAQAQAAPHAGHGGGPDPGGNRMVGTVDHSVNGFDPTAILTDFDWGRVVEGAEGPVREWIVTGIERDIEIAPGVWFPAWTYNG